MEIPQLYKATQKHVQQLFNNFMQPNLVFHNLAHTQKVVEKSQEIAAHYSLTEKENFVLYAAACFHDTGHLFTQPADHVEKSVQVMKEFFNALITDDTLINEVADCIMATKTPVNPAILIHQILCDADTYHFGTKDFKETNKNVKKEYELRNNNGSLYEFNRQALELLEKHVFYTTYCRELLTAGKQKNIEKLKKRVVHDNAVISSSNGLVVDEKVSGESSAKQKSSLRARGIQTMLRLTSENHLELSNMADGKANILISVNSIIISVILSVLIRRLEVDTHLTIPTIIFLLFSVITIVVAIMATRPKVTQGSFSKEDIINKKTNLLFFGNFHKATFEEYEWGMNLMMRDPDYLYGSLIQDNFQLGVVLGRKYRLIRIAYNVFMAGIILSVIAFTLAVLLNNPNHPAANAATSPL
jgi:predicted metal-dependent HD superfamily phosphohydrolase